MESKSLLVLSGIVKARTSRQSETLELCSAVAGPEVTNCCFAQGMDFTTDKLRSLVRKWQTLIEAHVEVKTTDGYMLRMFCIGFTKKRAGQVSAFSSAS